ncbi:hypothetical protein HELRODRAFT_162066 [Helobdella robusta]|uniref:Uncharacterized protein n=1 Tax=Helobdella robusta TaxID=6412 RepID=T1ES78_HELRO|nr:hypothetical protein HELRODRAFT_162066 [Helobdella robusta]ESN98629.1 hypothetical protein HELRODRAFT_162066 [Helobdella robusta]
MVNWYYIRRYVFALHFQIYLMAYAEVMLMEKDVWCDYVAAVSLAAVVVAVTYYISGGNGAVGIIFIGSSQVLVLNSAICYNYMFMKVPQVIFYVSIMYFACLLACFGIFTFLM